MSSLTEEERAILLLQLRSRLKVVREDFKDLGFGYEILDAVGELRDTIEYELDDLEVEYE